MKADIKSSQPEVKASKSVERFQRYRQLKFGMFLPQFFELPGALPPGPPIQMSSLYTNDGPFWPVMLMVGRSVLVRSRLSTSVQPPIANFPDNTVDGAESFGVKHRCTCMLSSLRYRLWFYFRPVQWGVCSCLLMTSEQREWDVNSEKKLISRCDLGFKGKLWTFDQAWLYLLSSRLP